MPPVSPLLPQELTVGYIGYEGEWVELRPDALAPLAGLRGLATLRLIAQKLTRTNVGMIAYLAILGHAAVGTDGLDCRLGIDLSSPFDIPPGDCWPALWGAGPSGFGNPTNPTQGLDITSP
jgi:hypothetical protein